MRALTILSETPRRRPSRDWLSRGRVARREARAGGDSAVFESLRRGLLGLGVSFDCNPPSWRRPAPVVVVQSGLGALEAALAWKAEGRVRRLLAGPNLVVFPGDHPGVSDPLVDLCLVPSEWVKELYEADDPSLAGRVAVWPAGVDERAWSPPAAAQRQGALVYRKNDDDDLYAEIVALLEARAIIPSTLTYGQYERAGYRRALGTCSFAIFLSRSESQGIALAEAWSMDVPTLVWAPGGATALGRALPYASPAPYLGPETGERWATLDELAGLLDDPRWRERTSPRRWLVEHMTDRASAAALLELAREE